LTWVTTDAISRRALDAVEVVGVLHDVGDIDTAADFKRAWNGFLRLYNLLQFLPESLCVTAQGVQDNAYQALEFVRASPITASLGDEGCAVLSAYAALVDAEILEALRQLAAHGVRLPAPACIPFELCGLHGNIIGQAELAWDDGQIAFVYTDDTVSQQAFAHAGWTVRTVEELGAHPMAFIQGLKGGKN
jgi:DEAD/DEAH box helicase domain-containing protein